MMLYHGTTKTRGEIILQDRLLRKTVDRYYSEDSNGPTTQNYIYLTNEITFSVYFANCHNLSENNSSIMIFRIDIPESLLEPDEDELAIQGEQNKDKYKTRLLWSLGEYKSCRFANDLDFDHYSVDVCTIINPDIEALHKITKNAGYNYQYVIDNYSKEQKYFIENLRWVRL